MDIQNPLSVTKVICWQSLRYFLTNWLLVDGIFILEYQVWPIFYQILMNHSRKKLNRRRGGGGVEDMEFSHVLKKEHVEIPGVNFNKHRIAEFPWVLVFNLGLQFNFQGKGVSHNFAWNFQGVKVCFLWKF